MTFRKRYLVVGICVFLMVGLVTGIGILLWRKHVDEENDKKHNDHQPVLSNQLTVDADASNIILTLGRNGTDNATVLSGVLAYNRSTEGLTKCSLYNGAPGLCFQWKKGPRVEIFPKTIAHSQTVPAPFECFTVNWVTDPSQGDLETPEDCYSMSEQYWYGGFEQSEQVWPINKFHVNSLPYITGDAYHNKEYGDIVENIFVSSSGVGIYVNESTPLYLSFNANNSNQFCLKGKVGLDTPFFHRAKPFLQYDVCKSTDIVQLWKGMSEIYLPKPKSVPSLDVFRYPIWCTWATYKEHINQSTVLDFANKIIHYNFSISQLEIDDDWTPKYGDFYFTAEKFPEPQKMIANLSNMGIPVTIWMHWFFNNDSDAFQDLNRTGYLIKELDSDNPLLVKWWRGTFAGVLDVTNPAAVEWYLGKTENLTKNYGVQSFKFDAGEVKWLKGRQYRLENPLETPNYLTTKYVEMTYRADTDRRRQEVRVGFRSQADSLMVRMLDRDSSWSHNLGIQTLIPCALTFGLMGYPYVLPDMIGGNAYDPEDIDLTVLPDKELFIRWLQASTFMPVLQFSVVPWAYDGEVIKLTQKFIRLHEQYADKIIQLAINAEKTGDPIVRPVYSIASFDETALTLDNEFLLGDDLLVAPVLTKGAVARDIYLPAGKWLDQVANRIYTAPTWLRNYNAPLDVLPYFTKIP